MSNNYWNQPPENNNGNNGSPRSDSMVRNYSDQTMQAPPQYSPLPNQPPQGAPPSQYSPSPPVYTPQQQEWPAPQAWPTSSFLGNAMQTVRRWTGKMTAARSGNVDQDPLVLYRPSTPPPALPPRSKPWKRSHAVRVALLMRQRRERLKRSRPTVRRIVIISFTIFALLLVIALSSGAAASGYVYYNSQLPRVQGLANSQIEQSTRIYDRNGNLLYTAYDNKTGRGTPVSYQSIPGVMQDAMIAAEDHTFWDNSGIDPQGILRAATEYTSSGSVQSGGSTITQQVIKNLTNDKQVSLQRKIPEAALAIVLTQRYPKSKILQMYFNISPFGAQELGVDAAAEDYFGLRAKCKANFECTPAIAFLDRDLTKCKNPNDDSTCSEDPLLGLARASLLAGMPQNPVSYDPTLGNNNIKRARGRQDYVLQQMLALNMHINTARGGDKTIDNGPITPDIIRQVEKLTKKMTFPGFPNLKRAPHFVDWVTSQLEIALGTDPKTRIVDERQGVYQFLTGGFNIRTSIDLNLQTYVENAAKRHIQQKEYQPFTGGDGPLNITNNLNDSAVVVMNAKTGEVLAMNGSTDWYDKNKNNKVDGQFNAALAARSPGSSFKPIVLAAAMEMGWYEGIVLPDKKTYFPTGLSPSLSSAYVPTDYGGDATHKLYNNTNFNIHWNIANSYNIPALKTSYFAGPAYVYNMAQRLGITAFTHDESQAPSMGIGSGSATLLQMTDAYQAFANNGWRIPPHGILDIYDNYGNRLYHYDTSHPNGGQAISPQIAFMITSILKDESARYPEFGNDHVLSMWDQWLSDGTHPEVATKTGTTDNFTDNLAFGYTPDVVVGVWTGNADNSPMQNSIGITGAAPIWHSIIEYVSGFCNYATDNIKCPPLHFNFRDRTFPSAPQGVIQSSVNTVNGLAGAGYTSWMLQGEQPQQSGLTTNNGNGTPTPTPIP